MKIQIQYRRTLLFQVQTCLLISDFSPWQHEERDTLLSMLTPPQHVVHLVMFKISVGRDPKNSTASFNGQNPTLVSTAKDPTLTPMVQSQLTLLQILKFSGPSLPGMTSSILQPHFLSGGLYYDKWWLSYSLRASVTAPNDYAPGLKRLE